MLIAQDTKENYTQHELDSGLESGDGGYDVLRTEE